MEKSGVDGRLFKEGRGTFIDLDLARLIGGASSSGSTSTRFATTKSGGSQVNLRKDWIRDKTISECYCKYDGVYFPQFGIGKESF